jgi:small subunit ribosomal protein S9
MATTATKKEYIEGIGRRKTAVARVRITPGTKTTFSINDKDLAQYFPTKELQSIAEGAFEISEVDQKFDVSAKIVGGGVHAQAESLRHGIARALNKFNPELRALLKKAGYLKRDQRSVERKKFGLKKARKRAQWSKR